MLDRLDDIVLQVPGLAGRIDTQRIAVAGYSMGGHTASMLLGMQLHDVDGQKTVDMRDERIRCGVILAGPGNGVDLNGPAGERYPALKKNTFDQMTAPALVVAGDKDFNPAFSDRLSWRTRILKIPARRQIMKANWPGEVTLDGLSALEHVGQIGAFTRFHLQSPNGILGHRPMRKPAYEKGQNGNDT